LGVISLCLSLVCCLSSRMATQRVRSETKDSLSLHTHTHTHTHTQHKKELLVQCIVRIIHEKYPDGFLYPSNYGREKSNYGMWQKAKKTLWVGTFLVCLSLSVSLCLSLTLCLSLSLSLYLSVALSLSLRLSICLSLYLSMSLSIYLCLSVSLSLLSLCSSS